MGQTSVWLFCKPVRPRMRCGMGEPISSQGNLADNFCGTSRFLPVKNFPFPLISRLRRQLPPRGEAFVPAFLFHPLLKADYRQSVRDLRKSCQGDCKYFFNKRKQPSLSGTVFFISLLLFTADAGTFSSLFLFSAAAFCAAGPKGSPAPQSAQWPESPGDWSKTAKSDRTPS